jgi:murein DD-endopeptidase MepM/ murein hydrolase activator NlpD
LLTGTDARRTRGASSARSRHTSPRPRRFVLGLAALTFAVAGTIMAPGAPAAFAVSYPSWDDVQAAKNDESAKAGQITEIEGLITTLNNNVATTQQAAQDAGNAYFDAQQAFALASSKAETLQAQADQQAQAATDAAKKAGEVAAQLYRNGGDDTTLQLFFSDSAKSADDILSELGQADMLLEQNKAIYDAAVLARNNAQSLTNQAEVQRAERDRLQVEAQEKFAAAQAAAQAAQAALEEQQSNLATLQAQLAALKDNTTKVVAAYEEGVRVAEEERIAREKAAEEERQRAAEEERKRREQEQQNNNNSGGGDSGGGDYTPPSSGGNGGSGSGGWVRPSNGVETSDYGPRYSQCGNGYCASSFHEGVDLASGCGSYIYAAHSGTVAYSGYNGGYGNYIRISNDDGTGIATGYGHIQYGGLLVSYGQWVNAGDVIALEGNTGNSFGCHVHYEVYINGSTTNPTPFMAQFGIDV